MYLSFSIFYFMKDVNVFKKRDVTRPLPKKVYKGLAEGKWKKRF